MDEVVDALGPLDDGMPLLRNDISQHSKNDDVQASLQEVLVAYMEALFAVAGTLRNIAGMGLS